MHRENGMKREVTAKAENFRGQGSDDRATNGGELHAFYKSRGAEHTGT